MRARTAATGAIIFLALRAIPTPAADSFRFEPSSGPYAAGVSVVEQYDSSRTYRSVVDALGKPRPGERARPLQTLVWYPAEHSASKPMTVADYVQLASRETSFGAPRASAPAREWTFELRSALSMPLRAVRDAPPVRRGRFPLIIYAPSFSSTSWENADLCEYLASLGYVVIASPSLGATTRNMTQDVAGVDAQARDISFLIGFAHSLPNADLQRVAVVGFSWGGMANLFAAARDDRIAALVALDGSLRYYPGLVRQAGDVHPERMRIPLLYFASQLSLEDLARFQTAAQLDGRSVLNEWTHGDLLLVRMLGLIHDEFSSMFQRRGDEWTHFDTRQHGDYAPADGIAGYAWVARYTAKFLDAYLKHDQGALAFLARSPVQNGVPAHLVGVSYRQAEGTPASLDAFREALGRGGFERAAEVYADFRKSHPGFELEEAPTAAWAEELIDEGRLTEATDLLELLSKEYPDSTALLGDLGEAYRLSGKESRAIESFRRALHLDPENDAAERGLERMHADGRSPRSR